MGDLTRNFSNSEFHCECGCGFGLQDGKLTYVLQRLRDHLNAIYPMELDGIWIKITGPSRCRESTLEVGGTPKSKHLEGIACDFKVINSSDGEVMDPRIAYRILNEWYPDTFGIGLYHNRVHLDTREAKARWAV